MSERRGHHTHHPRCRPMCPLSPLTRHATPATLSQMPRLTSHTHMACFVWLLPSTHSHTGCLTAHTPSTHHHHWVCVCSSTCSHPPLTHTHTRDAQAWPMHGWLLVWSPPPRPLCPTITHTHTHTAGLVVWAMVVLGGARVPCVCLPRHHHTRLPSHHHHQRSCATTALTHTGLGACTTATHTRHMHHHTHQGVLCVDHTMPHPPPPTPSPHSHTHHMAHTHTASATLPQWCLPSLTTPSTHTHTTDATHTHHTGDRPRPSTPLAVAFREPPPPRWSCPFALLSSSLLVHQPLFLSLKHALTRPSCAHHHHHAIHPVRVVCIVGMDSTKHHSGCEARHSHAC